MTKNEIILEFVERIKKCKSKDLAISETRKIIKELNSYTYTFFKRPIDNAYKIEILTEVKNKLQRKRIKKAQEDEYLMSSFSDVMEYLSPAVEILETQIEEIQSSNESNN